MVESEQHIQLLRPVVEVSDSGGRELGERYWREIRRCTLGLVRARRRGARIELVVVGAVPLLRFGAPETVVEPDLVTCRFPIEGGILASRPGGSLAITQRSRPAPELSLAVSGYEPRLEGPAGDRIGRALYRGLQERAHVAVSRRFLESTARSAE